MRLATLADGSRDGQLAVVSRDGSAWADASTVAPCLQAALDRWEEAEPRLRALADALDAGRAASTPLDLVRLGSPLPRAYEWIDGSAIQLRNT
jgi:fumarylacetoacetate (FAA) hydrolase